MAFKPSILTRSILWSWTAISPCPVSAIPTNLRQVNAGHVLTKSAFLSNWCNARAGLLDTHQGMKAGMGVTSKCPLRWGLIFKLLEKTISQGAIGQIQDYYSQVVF
jgi:hypothetical protein